MNCEDCNGINEDTEEGAGRCYTCDGGAPKNPLYSPARSGLEHVATLCLTRQAYQFDLLVVWRRLDTGALVYGTDRGCSCPTPFEGVEVSYLRDFSRTAIQSLLRERERTAREDYGYDEGDTFWTEHVPNPVDVSRFWEQVGG